MKKSENNKGITLIALVVTIVVLIILSVITVNIIFNEDGIIKQAKTAKELHEREQEREELENIKIKLAMQNTGKITMEKYIAQLSSEGIIKGQVVDNSDGSKSAVTNNGTSIKIVEDELGNININFTDEKIPIPDANEEIIFENLASSNNTVSVKVRKRSANNLKIEYKVNSGEYKEIEDGGTINNLSSSDIVTARLTDGKSSGSTKLLNIAQGLNKMQKLAEEKEMLELVKTTVLISNLGEVTVDKYIEQLIKEGITTESQVIKNPDNSKQLTTKNGYSVNVAADGGTNINITVTPIL